MLHYHKRYSIQVILQLQYWFDNKTSDFDCVDNYRVALTTSPEEISMYHKQQGAGCCGSVDEEIEIEGQIYLVGFNYGH